MVYLKKEKMYPCWIGYKKLKRNRKRKNILLFALTKKTFNKYKTELICYPGGITDASYSLPKSVTQIRYFAINNPNLKNKTLNDQLTIIGDNAFFNCTAFTDITIPDNVKDIGAGTFDYCKSLKNVWLPEGLTSIRNGIFYGYTALKSITEIDKYA